MLTGKSEGTTACLILDYNRKVVAQAVYPTLKTQVKPSKQDLISKNKNNWAWWHIPVIVAFGRLSKKIAEIFKPV